MLKSLFPVLFLSCSLSCHASLTVVADLGGESTTPLFDAIAPRDQDNIPSPDTPVTSPEQAVFPVVSQRLHPGSVSSRTLSLPGMTPLFLLGDDPRSLQWLKQQYTHLVSLNATGLVVSVKTAHHLAWLQQQAPGLTLLPASGDDLAARLQLDAYPVLITDAGLSQ